MMMMGQKAKKNGKKKKNREMLDGRYKKVIDDTRWTYYLSGCSGSRLDPRYSQSYHQSEPLAVKIISCHLPSSSDRSVIRVIREQKQSNDLNRKHKASFLDILTSYYLTIFFLA